MSHLLKKLHKTEFVAVLLRDSHADHIGGSSNQSSISFKHRNRSIYHVNTRKDKLALVEQKEYQLSCVMIFIILAKWIEVQ